MEAGSDTAIFPQALHARARQSPSQIAYCIHTANNAPPIVLTCEALDRQAREVAGRMLAHADPGDRALLLLSEIGDFLPAFMGCLYGGIVAVPTHVSQARSGEHVAALLEDADPRLVLATRADAARAPRLARLAGERLLLIDGPDRAKEALDAPLCAPGDLALLQYTSGSMGRPRGVAISHENLVQNALSLRALYGMSEGSWAVSWLPLFHDMGLIGGALQPLFTGNPCVLMPPAAFMQNPLRWLRLVSDYKAEASVAPNFAFDLCVDRITAEDRETLDLSGWRVAICGAEPVRADTLARFAEAFAPAGFRAEAFSPAYGLAEATLAVTGVPPSVAPTRLRVDAAALGRRRVRTPRGDSPVRVLVAAGPPLPGVEVEIADPESGATTPPGQLGEIRVAGGQVARGYWRQQAASASLPDQTHAGPPEKRWLATGDLGFIHAGELFVIGRIDDMIIVRGRNHAPHDIEHTTERASAHLRANAAAAFLAGPGGDAAGEEGLVLVAELVSRSGAHEAEAIVAAVRSAAAREHGLDITGIALLRPHALPRTTSGKLRRKATRAAWEQGMAGALHVWRRPVVASVLPERPQGPAQAPELLIWLQARCAVPLGVESWAIERDVPVVDLGLSSQEAMLIAGELSDWLGREIEPTVMMEPDLTLASLAARFGSPEATPNLHQMSLEDIGVLMRDLDRLPETELRRMAQLLRSGGKAA